MNNKLTLDELRDRWNQRIITEGEIPLLTFEQFLVNRLSHALNLLTQAEHRLAEAVHSERNQYWYKTEAGMGEEELDHMHNRQHEERLRTLELLGWTVENDADYHCNVRHPDGRYVRNGNVERVPMTSAAKAAE